MINNYNDEKMADFSDTYFGNYRLVRLLGQGAFASVYLGEHCYLKRPAAIKVLRTVLAEQEKAHFLAEAKLLAQLSHPRIVRVLEFTIEQKRTAIQGGVTIENIPVLIMDYIDGGNLRTIHPIGTRLQLNTVVTYIKQAGEALQYAHSQRIIHRDLKPENLLMNQHQEIMLSDFGLALLAPESSILSQQNMVGTIPYIAPEQLRGKSTFASDQYSLAIIAYEWLCGSLPFRGGEAEIIMQHISSPPPRLRAINSSISQAVENVILKALAKEPQQRYDTVQAFVQALEQASKKPKYSLIIDPTDFDRRTSKLPSISAPRSPQPPTAFPQFYYLAQKPVAMLTDGNAALAPVATNQQAGHQYQTAMVPAKQRNRLRMIQKVRTFWITGVLEPSLHNTPFITPEFRESRDAVANPWESSLHQPQKQPQSQALPPGTSIIEIYDNAGGELLILGEAGSGKTTLLLQLARNLLDRSEKDMLAPIPVILLLSSWSEKQLPIEQWIIEELNSKYQVPRILAGMWLQSEMLLPLLDGLDEVSPGVRSDCIIAINTYKQAHGLNALVVCSRLTDYLLSPPRVLLSQAVIVQSLTTRQITNYFLTSGQKFHSIYQILRADPILQKLITTPLMLNIVTLAYQDKSPVDLLAERSSTERYQHIFRSYVERMLKRHSAITASPSHTSEQFIHWLASLAREMQQHGKIVFYIEQLQPEWINKDRWLQIYMWIAVLLPGALIGGLTSLLSNDLFFHAGDFKAVFLDSVYGLMMGYLFSGRKLEQMASREQSVQRIPEKKLLTGNLIITPIFLGLISILFLGFAKGWPDGLINGTYLGIMSLFLTMLIQRRTMAKSSWKLANRKQTGFLSRHPLFEHITNGLMIAPICGLSNIFTNVIRQGLNHYSLGFYLSLGLRESLHNLLLGILISLLLFHMNEGAIRPSEIIVWSWSRFWHSFLVPKYALYGILLGTAVGITYGLKEALEGSFSTILSAGLSDTLLLTLGFSLVFAVFQGISSSNLANHYRYKPNEGIHRSLSHGITGAFVGMFTALMSYIFSNALVSAVNNVLTTKHTNSLVNTFIVGLQQGVVVNFRDLLLLGLAGGLLAALLLGGLAALQHGILRFILWRTDVLPLKLARTLDYATGSAFLRKVGGGYIFIHRFLLEYFASLEKKQADSTENEPFESEDLVNLLS